MLKNGEADIAYLMIGDEASAIKADPKLRLAQVIPPPPGGSSSPSSGTPNPPGTTAGSGWQRPWRSTSRPSTRWSAWASRG